MSDGYPSIAPSISRDTLIRLGREGWSASQVRHCLEMLDDTGIRLLAVFGDPRCAARVDGAWVIVIADLVVSADALRRLYRAAPSAVHGLGCPTAGIIADALLLAATTGPLTPDRIDAMAGKLAPAAMQAFDGAPQPEWVTFRHVEALVSAGLLRVVGLRGGAVAWELTDAGRRTVDETILPAWWRLAESPDGGASAV